MNILRKLPYKKVFTTLNVRYICYVNPQERIEKYTCSLDKREKAKKVPICKICKGSCYITCSGRRRYKGDNIYCDGCDYRCSCKQ